MTKKGNEAIFQGQTKKENEAIFQGGKGKLKKNQQLHSMCNWIKCKLREIAMIIAPFTFFLNTRRE